MHRVAYSFWGFLADVKMNDRYEQLSTPDGNAFYSWCIIHELQTRGNSVIAIMPDRDKYVVEKLGEDAFKSWCKEVRYNTYRTLQHIDYSSFTEHDIFHAWDNIGLKDVKYILHEWRMLIPGRNDISSKSNTDWQPDYYLQICLLKYCELHSIKLFIFDLDYKLSYADIEDISNIVTIIELGDKWSHENISSKKVYIPFDFAYIDYFTPKNVKNRNTNLVYVGNRYERDWCIDKYVPEDLDRCIVYGNWTESGRDSETRWPLLKFGRRLQLADMHDVYDDAICTLLLAKKEYCQWHFMTARIIEAIFYGCVPLFIEEYGDITIHNFAGAYFDILKVSSKDDVISTIKALKNDTELYFDIIYYLRSRLFKMDVRNFIDVLEE